MIKTEACAADEKLAASFRDEDARRCFRRCQFANILLLHLNPSVANYILPSWVD